MALKITILGSGTSQGVPVIGCDCAVCRSNDPKDNRMRSSVLIEQNGETYCIDTGPDFRLQMLQNKVKSLRGLLYTHEHKDHLAGMDDIRAFNHLENRPMEIYCSKEVEQALKREYYYVFTENKHGGIPSVNLHIIDDKPFQLEGGLKAIPIKVKHHTMPVLGYRFGDFTYITDAKTIAEEEIEKVKGSKVLIVNALRIESHISHFNLAEALAFIEKVNPEKAYLTHISHLFGKHEDICKMLPKNVSVCFDGMTIEM